MTLAISNGNSVTLDLSSLAGTGTDSQTLAFGIGTTTQTTLEIADGNSLTLQASGALSFSQTGTDTLALEVPQALLDATNTDSQTLSFGESATSTQTTLSIADGNSLTLQASGALSFTQTGTDTLALEVPQALLDATNTDSQTLSFGNNATSTQTTLAIADGNSLTLQASGALSFTQTGTDTLALEVPQALLEATNTDSQTLSFGNNATATQTTLEIADGNSLTLQASGALSFTQTGTDTLALEVPQALLDATNTDSQTLSFGNNATSTQTTLEIADGNSLTLQASGALSFTQTGTDTLALEVPQALLDATNTDSQTLAFGNNATATLEIAKRVGFYFRDCRRIVNSW